jgi:hypothetical protein
VSQIDPHAPIKSHYWEIKYNEARPFILGAIPFAFFVGFLTAIAFFPRHVVQTQVVTKEVPVEHVVIRQAPVDTTISGNPTARRTDSAITERCNHDGYVLSKAEHRCIYDTAHARCPEGYYFEFKVNGQGSCVSCVVNNFNYCQIIETVEP